MLKKSMTMVGSKIQVGPRIKDGIQKDSDLEYMSMSQFAGSFLSGHRAIAKGEILEIVSAPKRKDGVNPVVVRMSDGVTGHVYWCEARASCFHI